MSFTYALRRVGDVLIVALNGRLEFGHGATHSLRDLVREQVAQGCNKILINLRDVSYTDTGGLGAMVAVLTTITNEGGALRFCEARGSVLEVLRRTRLDAVLKASDNETAALEALSAKQVKGTAG